MVLSKKRIAKTLNRLCGYAGWSAPSLFSNSQRHLCPINNMSNQQYFFLSLSWQAEACYLPIAFTNSLDPDEDSLPLLLSADNLCNQFRPRSDLSLGSSLIMGHIVLFVCLFCLFDLFLYVHSTIFQLCGTVLPGFNQY